MCRVAAEPILFQGRCVVRTSAGSILALNETATWLWMALTHGNSLEEAVADMVSRFEYPFAETDADARSIVAKWQELGLVELAPVETVDVTALCEPPQLDAVYGIGQRAVRVRCHVPSLAERIDPIFLPSRVDDNNPGPPTIDLFQSASGCFVLARNGRVAFRAVDPGYARGALLHQLLCLSWPDRYWIACLHGAAVGNSTSCLVLCGGRGTGKTTLAAALTQAGFAFMADDSVPIEGTGFLAWPLPFAMSLKERGSQIVAGFFPDAADAPSVATERGRIRYFFPASRARSISAGGLPVHALVFPHYCENEPLVLSSIDPQDAFHRLCANGSSLDLSGHGLRGSLSWLAVTPCFSLTYSSLEAAVVALKRIWATG